MSASLRDRYLACLLGAAAGDAAGAVEEGLDFGGTDASQQLLFVAEGLLRAQTRSLASGAPVTPTPHVYHALGRWLSTQESDRPPPQPDGWLVGEPALYQRRSLAADTARSLRTGTHGTPERPVNNRSEATVLLRAGPAALVSWSPWPLAAELAALTHGDRATVAATAFLAVVVRKLLVGEDLPAAAAAAAERAAEEGFGGLGEGWVEAAAGLREPAELARSAADVLTVALALAGRDEPRAALATAGACAASPSRAMATVGMLLGASRGSEWIDAPPLDVAPLVRALAEDAYRMFSGVPYALTEEDWLRYPG